MRSALILLWCEVGFSNKVDLLKIQERKGRVVNSSLFTEYLKNQRNVREKENDRKKAQNKENQSLGGEMVCHLQKSIGQKLGAIKQRRT